jgi:AraC family L-rhamnose operon regulatory protein RhaS
MAEHCGLRPSAFTDYCRRILNLTPARHLARLRMDAARRMLSASGGASVTEVALSCGFQTSQYFATVFHKNTGLSPRAWRSKHQGTKL